MWNESEVNGVKNEELPLKIMIELCFPSVVVLIVAELNNTHCLMLSFTRSSSAVTVIFALCAGHPLSGRGDRLSGERVSAGGRGAAGGTRHQGRLQKGHHESR